jgi:hypothetical protein
MDFHFKSPLEIAASITPQRIRLFPTIDNRSSLGIRRFYVEVLLKYFANAGSRSRRRSVARMSEAISGTALQNSLSLPDIAPLPGYSATARCISAACQSGARSL